jgi:hypothetical protein
MYSVRAGLPHVSLNNAIVVWLIFWRYTARISPGELRVLTLNFVVISHWLMIFTSHLALCILSLYPAIRGCIQKFPDRPPGARTANVIALCHWVQLYRYYMSRSSEFWAITLWRGQQRVIPKVSVYFVIDSVRKRLDTPSYLHEYKARNFVLI